MSVTQARVSTAAASTISEVAQLAICGMDQIPKPQETSVQQQRLKRVVQVFSDHKPELAASGAFCLLLVALLWVANVI